MRALALVGLVALLAAGASFAARGDPQRRITPADQARARSMLLRAGDFSIAYVARPANSGGSGDFYCDALDESDLTLTGDATSPNFVTTGENITSTAYVYESRADSSASWSRGTNAAGQRCLSAGIRQELQRGGGRLVSFKTLSFPERGQRSVAYRAVATVQGLRAYVDIVAMQVSRAETAVVYTTALAPPPSGELRRLTALVEKRTEKAMRSAS